MRSPSSSDGIHILTIEDVRAVYDSLVGAAAAGLLDAVLGPWTEQVQDGWEALLATLYPVFGQDKYPTLALKAARILHGGATTQYLMDGNKRLATAVMEHQLAVNRRRLTATNDELAAFVLDVSTSGSQDHDAKIASAADWIDARLASVG